MKYDKETEMKLHGIHHVTAVTADARRNLDFYARVLGLRFVKKTVNFDDPTAYHLYFGDETGRPGSIMTFFEYPGAAPGRPGAGMVHRVAWRVGSPAALDFWSDRLAAEGIAAQRDGERLRFADPEGLELELAVAPGSDLRAEADGIPAEHALLGFAGARAYSPAPGTSERLLTGVLGFAGAGAEYDSAGFAWGYDEPPAERARPGAGTVHHIAWTSPGDEHGRWPAELAAHGAQTSPVMDRTYFRSIYFREPSGVLFELATPEPGFDVDEPFETLGTALRLPPQHEPLRARLEERLAPLANRRAEAVAR